MKFDTETKRIVRDGVPNEMNGYDSLSVQRAVELKASHGAEVTVYTMGPPNAREALTRCLAMGADNAYHIIDAALAGSDTLATSRALALALGKESYDLLLFGYFSVDAETSQVGPEVAELMGLPQVTCVSKLEVVDDATLRAERTLEDGTEVVEVSMPAVITVTDGLAAEVFPSRAEIKEAEEREIPEITALDLSEDSSIFGSTGSPTSVAEIRIMESTREHRVVEEVPVAEAAAQVVAFLKERGALDPSKRAAPDLTPAPADVRAIEGPEVWVMAELGASGVKAVSLELIGAARAVADAKGGPVIAVLMGAPGCERYVDELCQAGADAVALAADDALAIYSTEAYASTLASAIKEHSPFAVLVPSTVNGRDVAARVAGRLELGLTGDCIGLEVNHEGMLVQLKPAFGGNVVAPIMSSTLPNMATMRAGMSERLAPRTSRGSANFPITVVKPGKELVRHMEMRPLESVDVADLDAAWSVIAAGMGVGGTDGLKELEPLRELLGAEFITTRDVADAGWMPRQVQVGLSGRSVAPTLYIGVGLRGDFNHMVGVQRAGTIVGVNNNRRASIFRVADIAVLADWHEFIPALLEALRPEMG
jgi:electron transfer flavoprotein alpha subunit